MPLLRIKILGAFPPPATPEEQAWLDETRARLRVLKSRCVIINPGAPNEEDITNFTFHVCHHDEGGGCGPEQEI